MFRIGKVCSVITFVLDLDQEFAVKAIAREEAAVSRINMKLGKPLSQIFT